MIKDFIEFLGAVVCVLFFVGCVFSFVMGAAEGQRFYSGAEESRGVPVCRLSSIATRYNPPYRLGCFLSEPRFDK